jgi:hypothetical protein
METKTIMTHYQQKNHPTNYSTVQQKGIGKKNKISNYSSLKKLIFWSPWKNIDNP